MLAFQHSGSSVDTSVCIAAHQVQLIAQQGRYDKLTSRQFIARPWFLATGPVQDSV
jgi:hypothetical protein